MFTANCKIFVKIIVIYSSSCVNMGSVCSVSIAIPLKHYTNLGTAILTEQTEAMSTHQEDKGKPFLHVYTVSTIRRGPKGHI